MGTSALRTAEELVALPLNRPRAIRRQLLPREQLRHAGCISDPGDESTSGSTGPSRPAERLGRDDVESTCPRIIQQLCDPFPAADAGAGGDFVLVCGNDVPPFPLGQIAAETELVVDGLGVREVGRVSGVECGFRPFCPGMQKAALLPLIRPDWKFARAFPCGRR